jgi:hypothetical protein
VSALTFDQAASIYGSFLTKHGRDDDPRQSILDFLEWDVLDEDQFAKQVRIVLASADFSRELTTTVMWLNDQGLDIQCIRLKPYLDNGRILLDVQRLIPLPEADEYSIRIKEKQRQERAIRAFNPDFTKYDLQVGSQQYHRLPKRGVIFAVIKYLCDQGVTPSRIQSAISWRPTTLFRSVPGQLSSVEFVRQLHEEESSGGRKFDVRRFFCADDELIQAEGATFAVSNQWGTSWKKAMDNLAAAFVDHEIIITPCEQQTSIGSMSIDTGETRTTG